MGHSLHLSGAQGVGDQLGRAKKQVSYQGGKLTFMTHFRLLPHPAPPAAGPGSRPRAGNTGSALATIGEGPAHPRARLVTRGLGMEGRMFPVPGLHLASRCFLHFLLLKILGLGARALEQAVCLATLA